MTSNGTTKATDEDGRPVVVMGSGRRAQMRSADEVIEGLWERDQIDRPLWCTMLCASMQRVEDPEQAGQLADQLYFEFFRRTNGI
jgi:hypothetical protein